MHVRALKEVTRALKADFSSKTTTSLPPDTRRVLHAFLDGHHGGIGEEESVLATTELRTVWETYVQKSPRKTDMFVTVLKELQPAIILEADRLYWAESVAIPLISSTGHAKSALEEARDFLVVLMAYDEDADDANALSKTFGRISKTILHAYLASTSTATAVADVAARAEENAHIAKQTEDVLVAFGQKKPKHLFNLLDDIVASADTRLQALSLLNSFLRHQTPHLYLVINTPLVERLLKCLMNDTSTTILSVALTSLIMLLPHIPGSLGPYLPRLFLVYSRLLCWEKFSELSTDAERGLVTDDRVMPEDEDGDSGDEAQDVGIDASWEKARPLDGAVEANTPEIRTYFTYLYGLYPLNFMSYIRKPRRFLKNAEFPGAESFDLDQAVIRSRTEQFRQVHLLHPNFYNMTVEEEMADPKWPKMDPADVVGDCQALCIHSKILLNSPGPPPMGRLPDVPPAPLLPKSPKPGVNGNLSPVTSHVSLRSGISWRDTQSTVVSTGFKGDTPLSKSRSTFSDDEETLHGNFRLESAQEKDGQVLQTNFAFLQREITVLRNELNFERWHKAQYSQHIGQIMRRNVKDATVDAETLNLINANRGLKKQLAQAQKAREATIKDSTLTRKQANALDTNMTDRFNKLKIEQETWQASADELRRLRTEMKQYRELLVVTEARELNKTHQLELAQRDLEELDEVKQQLQHALQRIHGYEYREFDFETALRERDILKDEKEMLEAKIQRNVEHHERMRKAYADKISELESRLATPTPASPPQRNGSAVAAEVQSAIRHAVADSEARLTQLKKAHSRLLEKHTDLEVQLEAIKASRNDSEDQGYDLANNHSTDSMSRISTTDTARASSRRVSDPLRMTPAPILPSPSTIGLHTVAGEILPSRSHSVLSRRSIGPDPLSTLLGSRSEWSDGSEHMTVTTAMTNVGPAKKSKIQPGSNVRVYGRGGAQNIKLKQKASAGSGGGVGGKGEDGKKSGFKGFRIG